MSRGVWAQGLLPLTLFHRVFARAKHLSPPMCIPCLHGSGASVSFPDSRVLRNYYCRSNKRAAFVATVPVVGPHPLSELSKPWRLVQLEAPPPQEDGRMFLPPRPRMRPCTIRTSAVPKSTRLAERWTPRRDLPLRPSGRPTARVCTLQMSARG